MENDLNIDVANEPAAALTYGMSTALRDSGLLNMVGSLSHEDKACLIRYLHQTDELGQHEWEDMDDEASSYTMEELNARIDEAEEEIGQGEGKTFDQLMDGFRQKLLWL